MRNIQSKLISILVLLAAGLPTTFAAVNPTTAGPESAGSFDMYLTLASEVQITGLQDINLDWINDGDITQERTMNFCVYSSQGGYTIQMQSNNGPNNVRYIGPGYYKLLKTGDPLTANAQYSYSLNFTDMNTNSTVNNMVANQVYSGNFQGTTDKTACPAGTVNAQLGVTFHQNSESGSGLSQGVYYDIVSLTVTPE